MKLRITPTIANEYDSRAVFGGEDGWPLVPDGHGTFDLARATIEAILADAEFNGDPKCVDEMPLPIGNAYRALAKQARKVLAAGTRT